MHVPVKVSYPGVYIQEKSSGVHAISGVATSIAAFVGYTARGPDLVAKHILGFADFERSFGGLAADSELSYAVQQFFSNGGTEAYVVRVPRDGARRAIISLHDGVSGSSKRCLDLSTLSTGTWSKNVVIDVDYEGVSDSKSFNLTFTDLATGDSETFSNVTMDSARSNYVVTVVNDPDNGSSMFSVAVNAASNNRPAETGTVSGPGVNFAGLAGSFGGGATADKDYTLKLTASAPPTLTTAVTVKFLAKGDPIPNNVLSACRVLERTINNALRTAQAGASVTCRPRTSPGSTGPDSIRITAQFPPDLVSTAVDAALTFSAGGPDAAVPLKLTAADSAVVNVARYWIGGALVPTLAEERVQLPDDGGALPGSSALIGGLDALDHVDLFNILCIPDATRANPGNPAQLDLYPSGDPINPNLIFSAAMSVCLKRRAFLLVDPPPDVADLDGAAAWKFTRLTVHDKNGAAYWPRPRLPDPLNAMQLRSFAPCGVVAGVYARTDADRGVWKAPAGIEARLAGVQQLTVKLTDAENGVINPLGLNALRNLPIYGMVSWGARTLVGADGDDQDWKYVPVRRLALFLEESLYRGLKWAVFEPNDEPLWAQIRLNVGGFLNGVFRQGGFAGKTPQEAYFVKCDRETTTPTDQALGIVNVLVGFAPLAPAEFVVITVQQMAGQTAI